MCRFEKLMAAAGREARGFQFHVCVASGSLDINSAVCLFALGDKSYSGYAIQASAGQVLREVGFCAVVDSTGLLESFTDMRMPLLRQERNFDFWCGSNKQEIHDAEYMIYVCARELISRWIDFKEDNRVIVSAKGARFVRRRPDQSGIYISGRFNSNMMNQVISRLSEEKWLCFQNNGKCGGSCYGLSKM